MRIQCVKLYSVLTIPPAALFMFYQFFQNSPHPLLRHSLRVRVCKLYQVKIQKLFLRPAPPLFFLFRFRWVFLYLFEQKGNDSHYFWITGFVIKPHLVVSLLQSVALCSSSLSCSSIHGGFQLVRTLKYFISVFKTYKAIFGPTVIFFMHSENGIFH